MSDQPLLTQQLEHVLSKYEGVTFQKQSQQRIRIDVNADALPALLALLQGQAGYSHLSAITCVDWIETEEFELVYHVLSYETNILISAHIRIARNPGRYLSIYDLYQPAAFFERDIHEMFGLYFEGAPSMEKFILTEWNGPPPMRKEFDSQAFVNDAFNWQQYHPEWLQEITENGGGIAVTAADGAVK